MKPPAPVTQMRSFFSGQYSCAPYTVFTAKPAAAMAANASFAHETGGGGRVCGLNGSRIKPLPPRMPFLGLSDGGVGCSKTPLSDAGAEAFGC